MNSSHRANLTKPSLLNLILFMAPMMFGHYLYADTEFQSTTKAVSLIELYTSEGCYSCPPADRWLSSLDNDAGLFTDFVPLAFHVDYWNYLGWRDTYSRAEFSQRQRRYHSLGQVSGVYTPGMFLDGREWRAWRGSDSREIKKKSASNNKGVGVLRVKYDRGNASFVFYPSEGATDNVGRAHIALLGAGIEAPIPAGENKGKTLDHDFVVLDLQQVDVKKSQDGSFIAKLPKIKSEFQAPRYALAAWITNKNDSQPIQATGTWIDQP